MRINFSYKLLGVFLLGLLLVVGLGQANQANADLDTFNTTEGSANLLENPGFEGGNRAPDGWSPFPPSRPGVIHRWDNTISHSGTHSVSIEVHGREVAMWRQVVPVSPNTLYTLSGYLNLSDVQPPGRCNLQIVFRDNKNKVLEMIDLPNHSGTISWIYDFPHEVSVRAPADATTAEVNLLLKGPGRGWFDDLFFGPTPTGSISGAVTSGGAPLEGARVSIPGSNYEAYADAEGRYTITGVPVAAPRYLLVATKDGYRDRPQGDVDVSPGDVITVDFDLEAGEGLAPKLRVKFASLRRTLPTLPREISSDAVIGPALYPESVRPYLLPDEYVDSDHPSVTALAEEILEGITLVSRTNTLEVAHAAYLWIVRNIEFDGIYSNLTFTDTTSGRWQTIDGGWAWGHSFTDWLYKPSEMLEEKGGICIEHSRLATALLRALGMPARPVKPYGAQFWVQLSSGEGYWAGMSTSAGRSAYRRFGDEWASFAKTSESQIFAFPVDEGPLIHSDWHTENKCRWQEVHPWEERYEGQASGYNRAIADLEHFAATGEAPSSNLRPRPTEPSYITHYSDFTLDLSNIGDQERLVARFPLPSESSYVDYLDRNAYWTNHPDCIMRTWVEEESNPPMPEVWRWFNIEFDLGCVL